MEGWVYLGNGTAGSQTAWRPLDHKWDALPLHHRATLSYLLTLLLYSLDAPLLQTGFDNDGHSHYDQFGEIYPTTLNELNCSLHLALVTSAEGGCFYSGLFVCPSDKWNICDLILTKFLGGVGHGPGTKWLNFGGWRSGSPSESRSPKSEIRLHWIIELPMDLDEILRRAGVWPL